MSFTPMDDIAPLKKFSVLGNFNDKLVYLAEQLAEPENWHYDNPKITAKQKKYGVLFQYIYHTFSKNQDENNLVFEDEFCIMNTGLLTTSGEEIFMLFSENTRKNEQKWFFNSFYRASDRKIPESMRGKLPKHIDYFDGNPEEMYFNPRLTLLYNMEHIIKDNYDRLPASLRQLDEALLISVLNSQAEQMKKRILRNNRLVVPQYYGKTIMYLAPLKFGKDIVPLAIEKNKNSYRINTILTPGMAYCNARLIMKPESNWLQNE